MLDIYKAKLNGNMVGFFKAHKWNEASRAAASHHLKETGETIPWEHFSTYWISPKHYESERVPEELYAEEEQAS